MESNPTASAQFDTTEKNNHEASTLDLRPVTHAQIKALRECINSKIAQFSGKGRRNKIGATVIQIITVAASVVTPILIGWKSTDEALVKVMTNYALISSAIAAGTATMYNFFDYKDLWVQYKVSRNELESVSAELDYVEASGLDNATQQQMAILFKSYVRVCADTNNFYRATRMAKDEVDSSKK